MTKKKVTIASVLDTLSFKVPTEINTDSGLKEVVPDYDDVGSSFKSFSRKRVGTDWVINQQLPYNLSIPFILDGVNLSFYAQFYPYDYPDSNEYYVKTIFISFKTNIDTYVKVYRGDSTDWKDRLIYTKLYANTSGFLTIPFEVPFPLASQHGLKIVFSGGGGAPTGDFVTNLYGWTEKVV